MKIEKMLKKLESVGLSDQIISEYSGMSVATISRIRREKIVNCRINTAEKIRAVYEKFTNTKVDNFL